MTKYRSYASSRTKYYGITNHNSLATARKRMKSVTKNGTGMIERYGRTFTGKHTWFNYETWKNGKVVRTPKQHGWG